MTKINFHHIPSHPLPVRKTNEVGKREAPSKTFANHLQTAFQKSNKLVLSKHAEKRLQEREINIDENKWNEMEQKLFEAKQLGVTDSLVLVDDAALIVSAKNNTVITAMNRSEAASQIFTNINGTIVLN